MSNVINRHVTPDFNRMQNMPSVKVTTILKWSSSEPIGYTYEFANDNITVTVEDSEMTEIVFAYDSREFDMLCWCAREVRAIYRRINNDFEILECDDGFVRFCAEEVKSHKADIIDLANALANYRSYLRDFNRKYTLYIREKVYDLYALQMDLASNEYDFIPDELS